MSKNGLTLLAVLLAAIIIGYVGMAIIDAFTPGGHW